MDANPDFSDITTLDLESSITGLTANLNAAIFKQLMMIAEFDRRQGWGEEGVRSCAHWLNWRCGVSLVAAREKLRVGHALQHLPQTRQAIASGQLSYSKARAITRVATVDNEACLLSYARYGTASQLDQTVRLYRKQYVGANGEVIDPVKAERQHAMQQHDQRQVDVHWDESGCLQIRARLTAEQGTVVLKALEAAVESLKEAEPETIEQENASAGVCSGIKSASSVHQHRSADALVMIANHSLHTNTANTNTSDRYQVVVHVDSQVLSGESITKPTSEPDCYIEKQVALPVESARRLSCSCKIVSAITDGSEPLNIGRSTRAISTPIRRALAIRDGRCQFPGCDCNRHLDAHHIVHWSNGGETSLDNLIEVCHYHHVRLHEGGFSVRRMETGELRFYKPDGTVLSSQPNLVKSKTILDDSTEKLWSWNGDSMDYDIATYCLATATKSAGLAEITSEWLR